MENYIPELQSLLNSINNNVSLLSNASAFLNEKFDDINWVGFYLIDKGQLVLGPFQGKVACTNIQIGKGVCGTAYERKMLLNIANVHEFPGHIACDSASNSEIVIPLIYNGKQFGVLDIDSPSYSRFNGDDESILQETADIISNYLYNNLSKSS